MRKPWPAKRSRVRLGVGKLEQAYLPKKKTKKKAEEKPEEVKEEEQAEAPAETTEEEPEKAEVSEEGEGVQETFGVIDGARVKGTVKFFNPNKGFGFIIGDDGEEYYVNKDGLKEDVTIEGGDKVSFKAVEGDKGIKAEDVKKLNE